MDLSTKVSMESSSHANARFTYEQLKMVPYFAIRIARCTIAFFSSSVCADATNPSRERLRPQSMLQHLSFLHPFVSCARYSRPNSSTDIDMRMGHCEAHRSFSVKESGLFLETLGSTLSVFITLSIRIATTNYLYHRTPFTLLMIWIVFNETVEEISCRCE